MRLLLVSIGLLILLSCINHLGGAIGVSRNDKLESNFQAIQKKFDQNKITVIFTMYYMNRVDYCVSVLKVYSSYPYTELIGSIIVIWNNVYMAVPTELKTLENIVVIKGVINSLNNRYIMPIPLVSTAAVVMHDDDMLVTFDGLQCLFEVWKKNQERIVARHVRQITFNNSEVAYVYDELFNSSATYHLGIRLVMFSAKYLHVYASTMTQDMLDYVTYGPGKCDDIALNMVSTLYSQLPPLRVLLPPSSVLSFDLCHFVVKGMGAVVGRQIIRSVCTKGLLDFFSNPGDVLLSTDELAFCPVTEKGARRDGPIDRASFVATHVDCKDMPKFVNNQFVEKVLSSETTPATSLLPVSSVHSASKGTFRLGIIAMEFWSVEMDGRKGG